MNYIVKGLGYFAHYGVPLFVLVAFLFYVLYLFDHQKHKTKRFLYAAGIVLGIATGFSVAVVAVHFL